MAEKTKITCNVSVLASALKKSSEAVPRKPIIPIHGMTLFNVSNGVLEIVSGSNEHQIRTQMSCISNKDTSVCMPSGPVMDILSGFPEEDIDIIISEVKGKMSAVMATSNGKRKYQVPMIVSSEFNKLSINEDQVVLDFVCEASTFRHAFMFAASPVKENNLVDSMRGVRILVSDDYVDICGVETNWFTKAVIMPDSIAKRPPEGYKSILVPVDAASFIDQSSTGPVRLMFDGNRIMVNYGGITSITAGLIGKFPNVDSLITYMTTSFVEVDKVSMLDSVKRLSKFSNQISMVKMNIEKDTMIISSEDSINNLSGREEIACVDQGMDGVSMAVSHKIIIPTLSNIRGDSIEVYSDSVDTKPAFIKASTNDSKSYYISGFGKLIDANK